MHCRNASIEERLPVSRVFRLNARVDVVVDDLRRHPNRARLGNTGGPNWETRCDVQISARTSPNVVDWLHL